MSYKSPRRVLAAVAAVAVLAAGCRAEGRGETAPAGQGSGSLILSIVGTNDLHGAILPRDGHGGLALFGGYVKNLRAARARDGGAVLLVDAGDMFQGTLESNLTEGASVVDAYNALGYAAAAIGNHEFDFGPVGPAATPASQADDPRGAIKARAAQAVFPLLTANLIDIGTGRPVDWTNVRPSVIVDAGGTKVGIVGVMTSAALSATIALNTRGLRVAPLAPAIVTHARALKASGASVIVVAAHAGARCTRFDDPSDLSSCDPSSAEIVDVARQLPGGLVDVIVAGHVHAGVAHEVNGIRISAALTGGRAFGRVDLTLERRTRQVLARRSLAPRDLCATVVRGSDRCDAEAGRGQVLVPAEYEGVPVGPDPAIVRTLAPAVERVRVLKATSMGVVLDTPIRRAVPEKSPLGNLFTDAFLAAVPGADLAINNTRGGLRADLARGPLTYGRLYETFPFDNTLVRLRLSGADLRRVFDQQLRQARALPGIAGLSVRAACVGGRLDVTMVRPSGRLVRDDELLVVVTTDFLANQGDGVLTAAAPGQGFAIEEQGVLARDAVADWLRRRGGHLSESDLLDADRPRWIYPGALSVRCADR